MFIYFKYQNFKCTQTSISIFIKNILLKIQNLINKYKKKIYEVLLVILSKNIITIDCLAALEHIQLLLD
jgi:hypothetical protein